MNKKSVWGKQLLGGYPRLENTAPLIANYIPKCDLYCEPFAGLGSVAKHVIANKKILNDKGDFAFSYLKGHFPNSIVEQDDFINCIKKYDSTNTFFLVDPPWRFDTYDLHAKAYCDRPVEKYYKDFLSLLPLKGNWILCSAADEHECKGVLSSTNYPKTILATNKGVIFGKKARVLLLSNLPFVNHQQTTLVTEGNS